MNRELYHHGVKGQKWGIRRYQNPDGTLTAEGRARFGVRLEGNSRRKIKELLGTNETVKLVYDSKELKALKRRAKSDYENSEQGKKDRAILDSGKYDAKWLLKQQIRKQAPEGKYVDDMANIYLDKLGFEKTEKGRKMVKNIIN